MRRILVLGSILALPAPALAGTIPPAELPSGATSVELGFLHAAADHGLTDRVSAGWMAWTYMPVVQTMAFRVGFRLVDTPDVSVTGLISTGITRENTDPFGLGTRYHWADRVWLQPALNASIRLFPVLRLRATLGPILNLDYVPPPGSTGLPLVDPMWWPNVELALRLPAGFELAAGYPDLVSVRYTW